MKLYAGTSGYSYKEWKGHFYPEKIPNDQMLAFYATKLPSVEINNTFYRMPRASMLATWAERVPADFRFVLKASQRITHFKRLNNAEEETRYLLETVETLEAKLGVLLFQLPPNMKKDLERLDAFLETLPEGTRAAFEFRHATWFDDDVYDALRRRDLPLCLADADDALEVPLVSTADWGYLRLRRPGYTDQDMRRWIDWIGQQGWKEAYVFFKHEDEAAGPKMAVRFLELAR
ncbi:MAG: DUF72 domain-containing protein [Candidatus Krumholzibacteria bacterium]|nr:DUF72 domain-containing protein [Candidatus Krumholzibacteria bacterium]